MYKPTEKRFDKSKMMERDDGVELENQFILRLPKETADQLHEALQSGAPNFKDRFTIKVDQDLRYGEVRFDHWLLYAKIVDLPTVLESLKTIDGKSFYKTADICQIMISKEDPEPELDEESPNKVKKKDPNKVDKKFLYPHGITPPCKNVRKRRFRKTLKKKYVEAPDIEKEVKRLLRSDNEAVNFKYEIINEDDDLLKGDGIIDQKSNLFNYNFDNSKVNDDTTQDINVESDNDLGELSQTMNETVKEDDIFGGAVSTSDEDDDVDRTMIRTDLDETSRLSADDSILTENSMAGNSQMAKDLYTEFNRSMFNNSPKDSSFYNESKSNIEFMDDDFSNEPSTHSSRHDIQLKVNELQKQVSDLKVQQCQKENEISSIQNSTLRIRMQETLDNISSQIIEKELEIRDFQNLL
ncbi:TAF7 family protein [Megaselia abdita]